MHNESYILAPRRQEKRQPDNVLSLLGASLSWLTDFADKPIVQLVYKKSFSAKRKQDEEQK